ncbi:MAG: hypothetical protein HY754_15175 [Nitrospirae bacterium]|nr:hypothetical protein [Nitrospirota bacterium]
MFKFILRSDNSVSSLFIRLALGVVVFAGLVILFSISSHSAEKRQHPVLPKEYIQKLKRIAGFIAEEVVRRGIKTVMIEDFTDFRGNPSAKGRAMAGEFRKQLASKANADFIVVSNSAEAVVTGILIPFHKGGKWRLDIKVVSDKGKIITSYSGIIKTF